MNTFTPRKLSYRVKPLVGLLTACVGVFLCGCAQSRNIATVKHADGSGATHYRYIAAGGFFRPGVIVVVSETVGSNAPVVLTQASGAPMAPGLMGTPAAIAEAALIGRGLAKSGNETTVIRDDPAPGPIMPPTHTPRGEGHGHGQRGH